jgi:hypothetical protein
MGQLTTGAYCDGDSDNDDDNDDMVLFMENSIIGMR